MSDLLRALGIPTKRKIFVSYHHGGDQVYYDLFSQKFADEWSVVTDNSLDRLIESDNPEYVMRRIRENYICGTSCTIVFCGRETPERKYVDWEMKASLDDMHGLIGIRLPTARYNADGTIAVPLRFFDNWASGYALWIHWSDLFSNPVRLRMSIDEAIARPAERIANSRALRTRNG